MTAHSTFNVRIEAFDGPLDLLLTLIKDQQLDVATVPLASMAEQVRALRFHALRHAAGSLVAREAGAHFVQAFLGHSRLSTTERYLHAKSRPQDVDTLNRAFAGSIAPVAEES